MNVNREDIFSVSEVSRLVKNVIDTNLPLLWIEGEIANFVHHSSGHIYFSMKDDNSTIRCAYFRQYNISLSIQPKNGDKVICFGKVDVYEKTGTYQLIVRNMLPAGIGELQIKFLALKKKLEAEGLFSPSNKKSLPAYPEKIGVVTSPTGAAFQDIKNVITRRYPHQLYLYPAGVQGNGAVPELIAGIEYFNKQFPVDLIIIGRGGGSQEDLFCFNDELLARTIFKSRIPVISAVGHEIDFTIADFVADLRAPTPSAAAELAVPNKTDLMKRITSYQKELLTRTDRYILTQRSRLSKYETILYQWHPKNQVYRYQQRIDEATTIFLAQLQRIKELRRNLDTITHKLLLLTGRISGEMIYNKKLLLESNNSKFVYSARKSIADQKAFLDNLREQLRSLSPQEALKRGYGIIRKNKKMVRTIADLHEKDRLDIILYDGKCRCAVEEVISNDDNSS